VSTYQGWTNYPTWVVNLWLTNDEGGDAMLEEYVRANDPEGLKSVVEECAPEIEGMYSDLFTWALGMVDWYEIIETHREDLDDDDDDDDDDDEENSDDYLIFSRSARLL
jgi:hypothetical protein